MILAQLTALLVLLPALVSAAIFPPDTKVKSLDPKGFRRAMKANRTAVVAFVAPWCGHCQKMAPEYSKAAANLHPLVPFYAVDCDEEQNKRLCGEQGVQGFPTVKVFPRGNQGPSLPYDSGERTSNNLIRWATRSVPNKVKALPKIDEISPWVEKKSDLPRVILFNKDKKYPLLWQVLGNNFYQKIAFGHHSDPEGKSAQSLGFGPDGKNSKVLVYAAGSNEPILYEGMTKYEPLTKFFRSVVNGTADLTASKRAAPLKDEL
ncbi:thioredoxin-like protein [Hygrophoropsis aurantiaca]|uniref:Thioredoxin-like protein n=1 Tax=Hygrophoropsis aurantiaca TaxID=72124 RepID=A0ACB8ANS4_9AGAM|nr:thioredoxin-like protein [Hygrophoropsis aurantiaca]